MAAPVRTGTASNVNGSAASGSTSVTVPADAEAVVAFTTHFQSNNNSTLSTLTLNSVAFTVDSQIAEGATTNRPGVYVGHLLAPATGSQTLAWAWSNAAARNNGGKIILVYVKGINSGDFKRASGVGTSTGNSSVTLATETTDLLLACASNYSAALNLDGTEFIDDSTLLTFVYDASEVTPSATSTTVNMTGGATATGMGAISLKEPTAGSNSDGNASFTLGGITFAATAENPFVGADFTLGEITFAATAEHPYYAAASFTLGGISFAATAEHPYYADADFTLGEITFAATSTNQGNSDGDAAFTLGAITFSALAAFGNSVSFTTSNIQFGSTGMLILYTNIQQSEVANDVYVCNLALGRLGEYQLMALTERTVPARNCNRFYLATVDEVLREHQWNFATGHATLSELAENPGATEWLHAYQLPSDFVRLRRLNNWTEEDEFTHWEIEKDVLLTDDDKAEIKYTRKITNVALWDPMAIEALSLKLAYKLALPITGSMSIAQQLFAEYQQVVMPRAQRVDASEAKQRHKPAWATSALVQSRGAGS